MAQGQRGYQPDSEFHELAGRLEGTVRALMLLAKAVETAGLLDCLAYSADLCKEAGRLNFERDHLLPTQRTMREIAQELDRTCRLSAHHV